MATQHHLRQYEEDFRRIVGSGIHTFTEEHRRKNLEAKELLLDCLPFRDINKTNDCDLVYRYLIARKWDVEVAVKSIRSYLQWRAEEKIDTVMWEAVDPLAESAVASFFGIDKEGYPVLWDCTKPALVQRVLKESSREAMSRAHYKMMERARYLSRTNGVDRITYVLDLSSITMSSVNSDTISIVKELSKKDQLYYPELMRRMLICNGGWAVTAGWKVIRPLLDERVQKKIQFLKDAPSVQSLAEYIEEPHVHSMYLPSGTDGSSGSGRGRSRRGTTLAEQLTEATSGAVGTFVDRSGTAASPTTAFLAAKFEHSHTFEEEAQELELTRRGRVPSSPDDDVSEPPAREDAEFFSLSDNDDDGERVADDTTAAPQQRSPRTMAVRSQQDRQHSAASPVAPVLVVGSEAVIARALHVPLSSLVNASGGGGPSTATTGGSSGTAGGSTRKATAAVASSSSSSPPPSPSLASHQVATRLLSNGGANEKAIVSSHALASVSHGSSGALPPSSKPATSPPWQQPDGSLSTSHGSNPQHPSGGSHHPAATPKKSLTPGRLGDGLAVEIEICRNGKSIRGFHQSRLIGESKDNLVVTYLTDGSSSGSGSGVDIASSPSPGRGANNGAAVSLTSTAAPAKPGTGFATVAQGAAESNRVLLGELLRESGHPLHTHLIVSDANRVAKFVLMKRNLHKQIVIYQVVGDARIHTSKSCKHSILGEKVKMARCGERPENTGSDARDWAVWGKVRVGTQEVRKYLAEKLGWSIVFYDALASLPIQDLFCLVVGLMDLWE